jgi:hypothetical protein
MTEAPFTHIVIRPIPSGSDTFTDIGTLIIGGEIPKANLDALVGSGYIAPLTPEDFEKYNAPAVVETVKPDEVLETEPKPVVAKATPAKSPAKKPAAKPVKKSSTK